MMRGKATAIALGLTAMVPSAALAFDAGGFAGGVLGGMIGSAIAGSARPRPVIIYRPRPIYRVVAPRRAAVRRHYAAAPRPSHAGAPRAAVVNTAADPFATTKSSAPQPIPVANKP